MKLTGFALLGVLGITGLVPIAVAQPATKQVTLGVLDATGTGPNPAFIKALRDLGYQLGRNLTIEFRSANGHNEELPRLATELVSLKPDVIVATGTAVVSAVKQATGSIPIVMGASGDPVGYGLVQSLAHPGANITGRSDSAGELGPKRMQLVTETLPGICCVARLANPSNPGNVASLLANRSAWASLGIEVKAIEAATPDQLDEVLAAPLDDRFKTLFIAADAMLAAHRVQIAEAALRRGLATFGAFPDDARAGFLEAYGENPANTSAVTAGYVDKILKGAKPADLPVQQPTAFELVVNLKTAKALGLTIPHSIITRADEVIE
jgi:putative tryptophan/tyrosine transport system substrate-binding protein